MKCFEVLLREEEVDEVEIQYMDFVTDVISNFAAAHSGYVSIARELLVSCPFGFSSSYFLLSSYQSLLCYFCGTIKQTCVVDMALYI